MEIEIFDMTQENKYWSKTIAYAEKCSWRAGTVLAKLMIINQFQSWERVFVACDDKKNYRILYNC